MLISATYLEIDIEYQRETFQSVVSVTRLGNLLHFGQLFNASGNNYFAQVTNILGNFCKGVQIIDFASKIIFGQLL